MSLTLWLSVTAVCALGAMSPGPSLAVVIRNTVGNGRSYGFVTAWSHALGVGVYAVLTTFGLALIISRFTVTYLAVTGVGAAYLLYLGVRALSSGAHINTDETGSNVRLGRAAQEGFFTALLNPKVAIYFVAVFSQFLRPGMGIFDHGLLSATATLVDGLWYSLVTLLLTHAGWAALLRRQARNVDRVTGIVLIIVALAGALRLIYH